MISLSTSIGKPRCSNQNTKNESTTQRKQLEKLLEQSLQNLLSHPKISILVRDNADLVTQRLSSDPDVLKKMLGICLRPSEAQKHCSFIINNKHSYSAFQILNSLKQDFYSDLRDNMQNYTLAEHITNSSSADKLKTSNISNLFLEEFFKILSSTQEQTETALDYFFRLNRRLLEGGQVQVILNMYCSRNIIEGLGYHFYSEALTQLIVKLLRLQSNDIFFIQQKLQIVKKLIEAIKTEKDEELKVIKYGNFKGILDFLQEKLLYWQERELYLSFIKELISDRENFDFVLEDLRAGTSKQVREVIYKILTKCLKLDSSYDQNKRQMLGFVEQEPTQRSKSEKVITLHESIIQKIEEIICKTVIPSVIKKEKKELLMLIQELRFIKAYFLNSSASDKAIKMVFSSQVVDGMLSLNKEYPQSTILHNLIQDIFVIGVARRPGDFPEIFLRSEVLNAIMQNFQSCKNSLAREYQYQIYCVINTFKNKIVEGDTTDYLNQQFLSKFGESIDRKKIFYQSYHLFKKESKLDQSKINTSKNQPLEIEYGIKFITSPISQEQISKQSLQSPIPESPVLNSNENVLHSFSDAMNQNTKRFGAASLFIVTSNKIVSSGSSYGDSPCEQVQIQNKTEWPLLDVKQTNESFEMSCSGKLRRQSSRESHEYRYRPDQDKTEQIDERQVRYEIKNQQQMIKGQSTTYSLGAKSKVEGVNRIYDEIIGRKNRRNTASASDHLHRNFSYKQ